MNEESKELQGLILQFRNELVNHFNSTKVLSIGQPICFGKLKSEINEWRTTYVSTTEIHPLLSEYDAHFGIETRTQGIIE